MRESDRIHAVQAPVIPIVAGLIRENPGTISLGQGVVHFPPPPQAFREIERFLATPENHKYGLVEGIPELVEAIEAKLARENGITVGDGNRVAVTAGSNMAFVNAVLAIADPGDEIVLLAPYYFNHEMAITMLGCRPVVVACDATYQPRIDAIAAALGPRTRAVVTVSPNNPTGAVYPEGTLRQINQLCRGRRIYHVHDEAYEYFTFDRATHISPGSFTGSASHTISLFSLSKAYGFASWRIGYQVIPAHLFEGVCKIQDTNLICPPVVSQFAAVGALKVGRSYCEQRLVKLAQVRRLVLERLAGLGERVNVPEVSGAFYVLARVDTDLDDLAVVERLIREHGVAVIPGSAFGMNSGCFLRISYGALTAETVAEGIGRLVTGLRAIVA